MAPPTKTKNKASVIPRSLVISIAVPLLFTLFSIHFFGSSTTNYRAISWPPLWAVHAAAIHSSVFMGLAAWLVWADGGFRSQPVALPLYLSQLSLTVVWDPLVLVMGSAWVGVVFCLLHVGTLFGIHACYKRVNPFAKDLVKPCLAWMVFLTIVTFRIARFSGVDSSPF